jgi:hypothetical protein
VSDPPPAGLTLSNEQWPYHRVMTPFTKRPTALSTAGYQSMLDQCHVTLQTYINGPLTQPRARLLSMVSFFPFFLQQWRLQSDHFSLCLSKPPCCLFIRAGACSEMPPKHPHIFSQDRWQSTERFAQNPWENCIIAIRHESLSARYMWIYDDQTPGKRRPQKEAKWRSFCAYNHRQACCRESIKGQCAAELVFASAVQMLQVFAESAGMLFLGTCPFATNFPISVADDWTHWKEEPAWNRIAQTR